MRGYGQYYLGLDIGTNSVGWAVTDEEYNILKFKNRAMWGVHLFENGNTAEDRRTHRCSRRRIQRRKQRVALLRELFQDEIDKIDETFFERLDESNLLIEDKEQKQKNTLFNDKDLNDKIYHKKYPTIYHLRDALMETSSKPDIRLVYLAVHHIIKYRGHFLFEGISDEEMPKFETAFENMNTYLDRYEYHFNLRSSIEDLEATMTDKKLGVEEKNRELQKMIDTEGHGKNIIALLAGKTVSADKLFDDVSEKIKFCFRDSDFLEKFEENENELGSEDADLIRICKQVFDCAILIRILKGYGNVSKMKIDLYEQHKEDLLQLKKMIRKYVPEKYSEVFNSEEIKDNYSAYINGHIDGEPKVNKKCSQENFCKYIEEIIKDKVPEEEFQDLRSRLEKRTLLPKQTTKDNSVFPFTIHRKELNVILNNASKYYPFLNEKDETNLSVKDKILELQKFKIPYYVGPLNKASPFSWVVRNTDERITPWNYERIVDEDACSQGFMNRLTNTCTYLKEEKVLPKNSLLYSEYMLYNELNNLKIKGEKIPINLKNKMIEDLFRNPKIKNVNKKTLCGYLKMYAPISEKDISGIDTDVKSKLTSYLALKAILGETFDRNMAEEIIKIITVFGDDRKRIFEKLNTDYSVKLSPAEISSLSKLRFKGWGKFSEKLLVGVLSKRTSENIMTLLKETNYNFSEIINRPEYGFEEKIKKMNPLCSVDDKKITYDLVEKMRISPTVKKGIWRALNVVDDVVKAIGHPPEKIFIETTRAVKDKKKSEAPPSRKKKLMTLYKNCKDWTNMIEGESDESLRGDALFLYYIQNGKCMYCGNNVDLGDVEKREVDHIYPRSKVGLGKDDSVYNNKVLLCYKCNQNKGNTFPLSPEVQELMKDHWTYLKEKSFINAEKYKRLTRKDDLNDEELNRFIDRQIVETGQSIKGILDILDKVYPEVKYVKGSIVSGFRHKFGFEKCRSVNDYHHAKDAYLNIVVGNAFYTKFADYWKIKKDGYDLEKIYDKDINVGGKRAWVSGSEGTIKTVNKYMNRNNILFTKHSIEEKGELFDQTVYQKKDTLLSKKSGLDPAKYGGYSKVKGAYFSFVEHGPNSKRNRTLEHIPIYIINTIRSVKDIEEYLKEKMFENPKVLIKKVKKNTLFEIDGFRFYIRGRTGDRIEYDCSVQLILSNDLYGYCARIDRYLEKKAKNDSLPEIYELNSYDNIKLYDAFISKLESVAYVSMTPELVKSLKNNRQNFELLDTEKQVHILKKILNVFNNSSQNINLEEIGGGKTIGTKRINKNMGLKDKSKTVKLIHQSPSGLFEKEMDLRKI